MTEKTMMPAMMDYSLGMAMRHLSTSLCPCKKCRERRTYRDRALAGSGRSSPEEREYGCRHTSFSSLPLYRLMPEVPDDIGFGFRELNFRATESRIAAAGSLMIGGSTSFIGGRSFVQFDEATAAGNNNNHNNNNNKNNSYNTLRGPVGIDFFKNETINLALTLIIEIFGVLVFFAVCTISFWITLGYYVVKLLVDLKNADKRVKTAVAIVVGLLMMAFLVTLVTNREGGFCCRAKSRAKAGSRWSLNCCPRLKGLLNVKAKVVAVPAKLKPPTCPAASPKTTSVRQPKVCKQKVKSVAIKSGRQPIKCWLGKCNIEPRSGPTKVRYTDKQVRAIYTNSKRYAIPCEMKQPPMVIVWIRELIARLMGS
ncbi:uncharacterized protein LOC117590428 [Drosophila guanche]|uniref:uncharacterized protein LOC117590428 n=1 Tax=Drosophila guanche TaxID=7266 RepID=UPI001470BE91|nr:uncharacterized protein LOC117590428 [Drosophila guanche]